MAIDIGRVGIWSPARIWSDAGPELREAAAELEELGYGAIWLGSSRADLELQSEMLSSTRTLVAATGILNIWTQPAEQVAASYSRLVPQYVDRLLLGFGAGHAPMVERAGMHYERPLSHLKEYVDELDAMDEGVPADRRILAALGPKALALAAERSLGAHPYLVTPEHTRRAREAIGPDALLAPEQKVIVETDPERARAIARATVGLYLQLPNYTNNLIRLGFSPADFESGGSDRLVDGLFAWGDRGAILDRISEHWANGADHVSLQVLNSTDGGRSDGLPREEWRVLAEALRAAAV
jgi:probable F420-dependent oxidoreductase